MHVRGDAADVLGAKLPTGAAYAAILQIMDAEETA